MTMKRPSIDWDRWNKVSQYLSGNTLIVGEVQSLSDEEIQQFNDGLTTLETTTEFLKELSDSAKNRFKERIR